MGPERRAAVSLEEREGWAAVAPDTHVCFKSGAPLSVFTWLPGTSSASWAGPGSFVSGTIAALVFPCIPSACRDSLSKSEGASEKQICVGSPNVNVNRGLFFLPVTSTFAGFLVILQ